MHSLHPPFFCVWGPRLSFLPQIVHPITYAVFLHPNILIVVKLFLGELSFNELKLVDRPPRRASILLDDFVWAQLVHCRCADGDTSFKADLADVAWSHPTHELRSGEIYLVSAFQRRRL